MTDIQAVTNTQKKPLRKDWLVWVGLAIVILFIASRLDSNVPEGIEEMPCRCSTS